MLSCKSKIAVLVMMLFLSLTILIATKTNVSFSDPSNHGELSATSTAMVYVDPQNTTKDIDETFTVDIVVADVENLYGVDIQFQWDPSILEYVSHTAKIPVGTYPDGILHKPGMFVKNDVDAVAGTYWVAYASFLPAPVFDGTGIAFNMTFKVKKAGGCALEFPKHPSTGLPEIQLSDDQGRVISYTSQDGYFEARDSFQFPLDESWTVSQRFGRWSYDWQGYHLGEDVLRSYEAPVYAPADGVVKHNAKRTGYGYVMIIEHELLDGNFVCSVIGHLREKGRAPVGSLITKGQMVGYLSSLSEENGGLIHLHYGIRKGTYSEELDFDGKWRYRGYGPLDIVGSWQSPSAFIDYYNLQGETPPSYDLTINIEGGGAGATASSASVYTLSFRTVLCLIASHPWFQRWIGTDNDNVNPTTVIMDRTREVIQWLFSEPPRPTPWELAIELARQGADYSFEGGKGWNWTMIWEGDPPKLVLHGWGTPIDHPLIIKKWLEASEIKEGYYLYNQETGSVEFGKGIDCSGLVFWAYNKAWGARPEAMLTKITPESTRENINPMRYDGAENQYKLNCRGGWPRDPSGDPTKEELQPGDLLFFDTSHPGDPDHVAMYVGNFLYDGEWYNVTHASGFAGKVTPSLYKPATGELITKKLGVEDQSLLVDYYGRPIHQMDNNPLSFTSGSPVDLMVTDPDGIVLTKEVGEVAGMSYTEFDLDGDGELDDKVEVWEPKAGNYLVTVIPEPGAPPTGNFTLEASANDTIILLADHAQISEIPTQPYIITQTETTIMLRNINIAINDVTLLKNVVGQGYSSSVNVTVQNQGNLPETFNMTVYANTTAIVTITEINLTSGNSTAFTFMWNTTSFAKGNYTISAYAEPVSGETYLYDNNFAGGWVFVTIQGDVDGDRDVDIYDVVKITGIYHSKRGDPQFNPNSDLDDDGEIKIYDVVRCTSHYGQSW